MAMSHRPWSVALVLVCAFLVAQETPAPKPSKGARTPASTASKKRPRPKAEYWLQAAEKFTADIGDESWRLTRMDKALLDARLCAMWWESNQARAHAWCASAADTVSQKPQQESDEDRNTRLTAAREVMRVISPVEPTLGVQVQDAIELAIRDAANDGGRSREYLAMALAGAANDAQDPAQAARLISESLRAGGAFQTITAIFNLAQRDPARADQSFAELLGFLRQSRKFDLADRLLREVFSPSRNLPPAWKQATVEAITDLAAVMSESESDRGSRCRFIGTVISAGDNIPQASAAVIRSVLADCESASAAAVAASRQPGEPNAGEIKTVDDCLRAAAQAPDLQTRFFWKYNAAMRAEMQEHNYDRGLDILDALSEEELRARPGTVVNIRMGIATRGAVYALEHDQNIPAALHIAQRHPENLRGSIELAAAIEAAKKPLLVRGDRDLMREAVYDLRRYRSDDPNDYMKLINRSLPEKGDAAITATRDWMRRIAEWEPLDPKALKPLERYLPPLDSSVRPLPFVVEIADADLDSVVAIGKSLRNTRLRASFDLGVLQHVIRRYVDEQRRAKPQPKTSAAGQ